MTPPANPATMVVMQNDKRWTDRMPIPVEDGAADELLAALQEWIDRKNQPEEDEVTVKLELTKNEVVALSDAMRRLESMHANYDQRYITPWEAYVYTMLPGTDSFVTAADKIEAAKLEVL